MFRFFKRLFRHRIPILEVVELDGTKMIVSFNCIKALEPHKNGTKIITTMGDFYVNDSFESLRKKISYTAGKIKRRSV